MTITAIIPSTVPEDVAARWIEALRAFYGPSVQIQPQVMPSP
jgi:hypothetical protein